MTASLVKIPLKHYVGLVKRNSDNAPLGYMTPWGTDQGAKNRMATVDAWAQGYRNQQSLDPMIIDNVPMSGFQLTSDIRNPSYGGNDKWRILDPRGFELEISSENLSQLLMVGVVEYGTLQDSCVWARSGANNVLLSTNSEDYKEAVQATQLSQTRASWRDVKFGNTITLQNGISGVYLGKYYVLYHPWRDSNSTKISLEIENSPAFAIFDESNKIVYMIKTPKLARIDTRDILDAKTAEEKINSLIGECRVESSSSSYYTSRVRGFLSDKNSLPPTIKIVVEACDTPEEKSTHLLFLETDKLFCELHDTRRNSTMAVIIVDKSLVLDRQIIVREKQNRHYNYTVHEYIDPNDIVQWYQTKFTVDSVTGNRLEGLV